MDFIDFAAYLMNGTSMVPDITTKDKEQGRVATTWANRNEGAVSMGLWSYSYEG